MTAATALCCLGRPAGAQVDSVDVLIRNGQLLDGSGSPARAADVGVRGDRIVFVGNAAAARIAARQTLDARGLFVAPGFIDPHAHAAEDLSSAERHGNVNYLMQGVTTVITGNDGHGQTGVKALFDGWTKNGMGTNAATYVGHGAVRRQVMGMSDAAATPAQVAQMVAIVEQGMRDGALGLSTGLYYAPGSYSTTDEVIALARAAGRMGGVYDSHLRDESSYTIGLIGAVNEALRIGREAPIPVNISHIKALGVDVWGQSDTIIALVRAARARGEKVTADHYPYTASGSSVGASLLPRWAEAGGRDSLLARLHDAPTRARLVTDMTENMRRRGGPNALLLTRARDRSVVGKRLDEIAAARGVSPIEAAMQVIEAGDAGVASFNMQEKDLMRFMREPWVMTGSDGSTGHPRKFGTFPRKLRRYVLDTAVVSLPFAIRNSSALAAETFGLEGRGHVTKGSYADIIVFDPKSIRDESTYEAPERLATGMRWVIVNGVVAVDDGKYAGALAGRVLRKKGSQSTP
jgi:N-acyl-D-aspartate/D-glutamate deacylase